MYSPDKFEFDSKLIQVSENYQSGDKTALDPLIASLMPFCLKVCAKTCGHYVNEYDEEAGIARLAIIEALEKYDSDKGAFLFFLGQVIRCRIIDQKRKEKKNHLIPLAFLSQNGNILTETVDDHFFEEIIDNMARTEEINRLKNLLADFNLCFDDLAEGSPRQPKSRRNAQYIAAIIAGDPALCTYLLERKTLPMKELEDRWKINRKIADRYRKYIIAAALIQIHDFPYLINYILPGRGGK